MQEPSGNQTPDRERRGIDVTYACDLSGSLTFLSEEGERISGYTRDEAYGMKIAELLDPETAAHVYEQLIHDAKTRVGTVYEIDLIARDGRRVPLEVSTRVVLSDGKPAEVQVIAVPSVIRNQFATPMRSRCVDEDFFFGSSAKVAGVVVCIA
jgi:PAS domain S-box-containing protein